MSYVEAPDFAEKRKFIAGFFELLRAYDLHANSWRALEVGGEGGVLAGLMSSHVSHLLCTDIINLQSSYDGRFFYLLKEKFRRNEEDVNWEKLEFLMADAQDLPFKDDWFDFCYSQNAFEHIPDPEQALREIVRVTRPGGLIYLTFDPLWTADSGSHFLHYIGEPWLHLLEDDGPIAERMLAAGASTSEIDSYRTHMNRRTVGYYRETFQRVAMELGVKILVNHEWSGCVDDFSLVHPNLGLAAAANGLSVDDLLVRGMRFLLEV